MNMTEVLRQKRDGVLGLAARHGARNVRVFGSVARAEASESSDIDLLVDFERGRSLLDLVALWQELEELLGCHVDLVTEAGLSCYLREKILSEAVPV